MHVSYLRARLGSGCGGGDAHQTASLAPEAHSLNRPPMPPNTKVSTFRSRVSL